MLMLSPFKVYRLHHLWDRNWDRFGSACRNPFLECFFHGRIVLNRELAEISKSKVFHKDLINFDFLFTGNCRPFFH